MPHSKDGITDALAELVEASQLRDYEELQCRFGRALDELVQRGTVRLGPDHELGGDGLTVRVRLVLEEMGLTVRVGREKLEDLVVSVPDFAEPSIPLVVKVKSGKQPGPSRTNLRQLDDWVFELSDESRVRKLGIQNQGHRRNWLSKGAVQAAPIHPTPHKGVLLYNGPLGQPFEDRATSILNANETEFAIARSFCVISMPCLLSWALGCAESPNVLETFWSEVQSCMGELSYLER